MLIRFYVAGDKPRERAIAESMSNGLAPFGDRVEIAAAEAFEEPGPLVDVAAVFGLKGRSSIILERYRKHGAQTLLFDKAFVRRAAGYVRVSLNGWMPPEILQPGDADPARWRSFNVPRQLHVRQCSPAAPVVYCGSSQKYGDFHKLGDATDYARRAIKLLRKAGCEQPVIYRPKPSWREFRAIRRTTLSRPPELLRDLLGDCWAVVTHGSHSAIEAVLAGVPALVLGPGAARAVAMTEPKELPERRFATHDEIDRWLAELAWWQWTNVEMQSGEMWEFLRPKILRGR